MENNIDKWLIEINRNSNSNNPIVNTELSKGMQFIKESQPKAKPIPIQAPLQLKPITNTQDILNNTLDVNFLDENIEAILRQYADQSTKDETKDESKDAPIMPFIPAENNISFHLFEENKESSRKMINSNSINNYSNNNYNNWNNDGGCGKSEGGFMMSVNNKDKDKELVDYKKASLMNDDIDSKTYTSEFTESIKCDSEDIENCLKEFNCFNNDQSINYAIKNNNALPQIEEERNEIDLTLNDIRNIIQLDPNFMKAENINTNINTISNIPKANHINSQILYNNTFNCEFSMNSSFVERPSSNHTLADLNEWSKPQQWDEEIYIINEHIFTYRSFRPNQREIINANIAGRDIFVCMPTGGGKSLTFQIPAIYQFGVTIVIMPLLSLIQDQISFLNGLGVKSIFLNADGMKEVNERYSILFHSNNEEELCKMVFLTPEKISQSQAAKDFLQTLYHEKLLLRAVIDEAHCVSQWGREFRPDYLHLKILKKMFPGLPILAVTATAPNKIREDVISQLGMTNTLFFRSSYNRTNLYIEIRNKKDISDVIDNIAEFITTKYSDSTGLIYCSSKRKCEQVCEKLRKKHKISCEFYHASLPEKKKNSIQEQWMNDEVKIIIATVAFGMGINKADVRFVIHHSMPKSFESYYQEIGRAGRDGNRSHCILYYSWTDRKIIEFLMSKTNLNPRMITENLRKTTEMVEYCEEYCECRRVIALLYFDEKFNREHCRKMCDNCRKGLPPEETDVTNYAIIILTFLKNCQIEGIEMTTSSTVEYLRGAKRKMKKMPNSSEHFGSLKHVKDIDIKKILRRLIIWKYIDEHLVQIGLNSIYSRLEISNEGHFYLNTANRARLTVTFVAKEKKAEVIVENNSNVKGDEVYKTVKKKFDYNAYKYNNNNNSSKDKEKDLNNNNIDSQESKKSISYSSSNPRRYQPNYEKENFDDDNEIFNHDEDFGYCTPVQFSDLLTQLKIKRFELLSEEKKRLLNMSTDGNIKQVSLNDIFTENGLKELCRKLPTTESELSSDSIFGVGQKCLEKYGKEFLYTINKVIKIYKIEKSADTKNHNMRSINSSRIKQAKRNAITIPYKESKKAEDVIKSQESIEIEEDIQCNYFLDNFKNADEDEDNDYEGFNSFMNSSNINIDDVNNDKQINDEEKQREDLLSLCKEAKNIYKKDKKRKANEVNDIEDGIDSDSKNDKKTIKKEKDKVDKRAEYFKNKAKWKKINAYKKKKYL